MCDLVPIPFFCTRQSFERVIERFASVDVIQVSTVVKINNACYRKWEAVMDQSVAATPDNIYFQAVQCVIAKHQLLWFLGHRLKLLKCCGACATITVFVKRAKAFNLTLFCVACFAFSNCIAYCVFPSIAQSNRVINLSILRREFYTAVACIALL